MRIGIICDVGLTPSRTLRRYLDGHGLLEFFDHWSFSDEVGTFKPDPAIFRHALAGLGVDDRRGRPTSATSAEPTSRARKRSASPRCATRACSTIPVQPSDGTDQIEGDHVLADHAELPAALGLA